MATFVLVPGAWHGAWCFRDLTRLLRARGHDVFPLTLTGVGDRAHLARPGIDLDTHITDVLATLEAEELRDVILVGHSAGGCVIGGVAERRPELLRALVYLDALALEDGECLFDHVTPEFRQGILTGAQTRGDGHLVPFPGVDFFAVGPPHDAWLMRRLTPHPLGVAGQTLRVTDASAQIPRFYIDCDTPSLPATHLSKSRASKRADWTYFTLHEGHDAFLTNPEVVAPALLDIAAR